MNWLLRASWKILRSPTIRRPIWGFRVTGRLERWFYKVKALVCLWLNMEGPADRQFVFENGIEVAYTDGGVGSDGERTIYWGECVKVGVGLLRNWWHVVDQDSN